MMTAKELDELIASLKTEPVVFEYGDRVPAKCHTQAWRDAAQMLLYMPSKVWIGVQPDPADEKREVLFLQVTWPISSEGKTTKGTATPIAGLSDEELGRRSVSMLDVMGSYIPHWDSPILRRAGSLAAKHLPKVED